MRIQSRRVRGARGGGAVFRRVCSGISVVRVIAAKAWMARWRRRGPPAPARGPRRSVRCLRGGKPSPAAVGSGAGGGPGEVAGERHRLARGCGAGEREGADDGQRGGGGTEAFHVTSPRGLRYNGGTSLPARRPCAGAVSGRWVSFFAVGTHRLFR